jgi:hypothetical protein
MGLLPLNRDNLIASKDIFITFDRISANISSLAYGSNPKVNVNNFVNRHPQ